MPSKRTQPSSIRLPQTAPWPCLPQTAPSALPTPKLPHGLAYPKLPHRPRSRLCRRSIPGNPHAARHGVAGITRPSYTPAGRVGASLHLVGVKSPHGLVRTLDEYGPPGGSTKITLPPPPPPPRRRAPPGPAPRAPAFSLYARWLCPIIIKNHPKTCQKRAPAKTNTRRLWPAARNVLGFWVSLAAANPPAPFRETVPNSQAPA